MEYSVVYLYLSFEKNPVVQALLLNDKLIVMRYRPLSQRGDAKSKKKTATVSYI